MRVDQRFRNQKSSFWGKSYAIHWNLYSENLFSCFGSRYLSHYLSITSSVRVILRIIEYLRFGSKVRVEHDLFLNSNCTSACLIRVTPLQFCLISSKPYITPRNLSPELDHSPGRSLSLSGDARRKRERAHSDRKQETKCNTISPLASHRCVATRKMK